MKKLFTLLAIVIGLQFSQTATAQFQYGLNPNDPNVVFGANDRPALPAWNDYGIVKWGHRNRLGWNPYNYGYKSYLYRGMAFRLKFPKTYVHGVNDGKKYPLLIFFHGMGEAGEVYDNEYQLLHGGQMHAQKVDNGTFDGFLFYAQSTSGASQDYFPLINELIDSLVNSVKVDIDRIIVSGLSVGGQATWDFIANPNYARKVTAALPMCAASSTYSNYFQNYLTIPIWVSNGGQDASPAPYTVDQVVNGFRNLGGNITHTLYPNLGHSIWTTFWEEPDYFPYMLRQHKANPLVYFQRSEFCPNDPVSVKMEVQPGYYAYEWSKDGNTIAGATSNQYIATSYGTYRARFKRTANSQWSEWSPTPVVVGQKAGTVTPPIEIDGLHTNVLPAPDGSTTVPLKVATGYASYQWRNSTTNAIIGNTNKVQVGIGTYKVMVTEQYGCSSNFSPDYVVVNANAVNGPEKAVNLSAIALSSNSIRLDWNDNPNPAYNETAFEIYRSALNTDNYKLVGKVGADVNTFIDETAEQNTKYFYVVRAVNNNAAAPLSNVAEVTSLRDDVPPTVPGNLQVVGTGRNEVSLSWEPSTDNAGAVKYEVYVNGVLSYITSNTEFTVPDLTYQTRYSFYVVAKDAAGNLSPRSNQVSATAALSGLTYKYYEGDWDALPDFTTLTPVKTGNTPNVSLTPRNRDDNFAFMWEGYIKIPASGNYTFETNSDDGSKLYIGTYSYNATPVVNNDGLHGAQYASGTINLTAGVHPITITFFEKTGNHSMNIYWRSTAAGINSRQAIPNSAFTDNVTVSASSLPASPGSLNVTANSYKKITITWADRSNNETAFEVARSTSENGPFVNVGAVNAGVTTYVDSIGLEPNTTYWYRVRAVNNNGASEWTGSPRAKWNFNNSWAEALGSNRTLAPTNGASFNTDSREGSHSVNLNGSNQSVQMSFSSGSEFPSDAYGTRSVAVWIKPANTTQSNRLIFDFGGNSNGLALRINNGTIQGGIARNSTRHTVSANTNNANGWVTNGWNHVTLVYNGSTLKLFINGVERGSTNLSSTSTTVAANSNLSRIGANEGTNAFNSSTTNTNYNGKIDELIVFDEALDATSIQRIMNAAYGKATTAAAPAPPATPTGVTATALSTTSIQVKWNDVATETGYELYRSVGNTSNFRLVKTFEPVNGGQITYQDNSLFANTNYYYKVLAKGEFSNADTSAVVMAKTHNNSPEISPVSNLMMRYNSTRYVAFVATDPDGDDVSFTASNLPSFVTVAYGGNTAILTIKPFIEHLGSYNITMTATDANGGSTSTVFNLIVNTNYVPTIFPVSAVTMDEGSTQNITVSASDADGNHTLNWTIVNAPVFAMLTSNTNGNAVVNLTPSYAHAGTYVVKLKVTDDIGAEATIDIPVTVNNVELAAEAVYMSTVYYSTPAPAPWNNLYNVTTNNLLNSNGEVTPIGIDFLNTPWNAGNAGAVTNDNSGVFPDDVIRDYFWFGIYGAPETVTMRLRGLNPSNKYNVTLFGSSAWTGEGNNGTTIYTINGVSKPLYVDNNSHNVVTFDNVVPNGSGQILITMSKGANTPYGMVNAIVLQKTFNDGTAPVLARNIEASAQEDGSIKLTWEDVAYNESRYLVHRSTSESGPYTVINPGASNANSTSYIDNAVMGNTTYYYKIEAVNDFGTSGLTNVASATTLNKAPVLNTVVDQTVNAGSSFMLNLTATDEPGEVITFMHENLPAFAQFQVTGNNTARITFSPSNEDIGSYSNLYVRATDQHGAFTFVRFTVNVVNPNIKTVLMSFGSSSAAADVREPWNVGATWPTGNYLMNNLRDVNGVGTSFGVRLMSSWDGVFDNGMITGGDRGVYPDNVIKGAYLSGGASNRVIQIEGLSTSKRYNIGIFSSNNAGNAVAMTATSGGQTVSIDGRYNHTFTGYLTNLTPNAQGIITVTLNKGAQSEYMVLNAMVIEEYENNFFVPPSNLFAETILEPNKIKLTWSDRANGETGYQIWRSTSKYSGYTLVATTGANVTTYTDQNLSANVRYYYKVRGVKSGSVYSAYSNIASNVLSSSIVKINFNANASNNVAAPWNNTNGPSSAGLQFTKLLNQNNVNSGVTMEITHEFNGPGFAGINTNNGVLPGKVMEANYWTDAGQLSQVKFTNLALNKKYRIGIFGSAVFYGNSWARYTCNGKDVYLNSINNTTKIVYLEDLVPDENGELYLDVRVVAGYPYVFTSALTIEGYIDNSTGAREEEMYVPEYVVAEPVKYIDKKADNDMNVYPNPFTTNFNIELNTEKASDISIMLFDLSGQMVYQETGLKSMEGINRYAVEVSKNSYLTPGVYFLSVIRDGKPLKAVKLVKVQ